MRLGHPGVKNRVRSAYVRLGRRRVGLCGEGSSVSRQDCAFSPGVLVWRLLHPIFNWKDVATAV